MIKITSSGNFDNFKAFFDRVVHGNIYKKLDQYAQEGVFALAEATPKRTGLTASSWDYEIEKTSDGYIIHWINTNKNQNVNIALLIQTGHGNIRGGFIQGRDYINPAMKPVFDKISEEIWGEVTGQ